MAKTTKKKSLTTLLVVVLLAVVAIGGMLAYLTDRDSEVNTFTVGDVAIDLVEDYVQGSKLTPGVEIKKEAHIENTGDNNAWVWMTIAVPKGADDAVDLSEPGEGWLKNAIASKEETIDGEVYTLYTLLYDKAIIPGDVTTKGLTKVSLDPRVDYNVNDGSFYLIENGNATKIDYDIANTKIHISAYAIQSENFANVEAAYAAYQNQWGDKGTEYADPTPKANPENGVITLSADEPEQLLTGTYTNGFTVTGEGTLYLKKLSIDSNDNALTIASGSNVKIVAKGEAELNAAGNAINVSANTKLDLSGKGELTAIGGGGNDSDTVGSGIGGAGEIHIHDMDGLTAEGYGKHSYGIGGDDVSKITIENTDIEYVKGGYVQPQFVSDPNYGKSEPEGGAAIGSGKDGAVITLNNVIIEKAEGGSKAAGIGASYWVGVTININNCNIKEVIGGNASAGIGGSRVGNNNPQDNDINITIVNSKIKAEGGQYAAGIGSGYDTYCHKPEESPICTIYIKGNSDITAKGGKYAAGIGTGHHTGGLAGAIENSVTINAEAGEKFYKSTYTTAQDVGFGVLDPARDGLNNTCSFDYKGTVITVPAVN